MESWSDDERSDSSSPNKVFGDGSDSFLLDFKFTGVSFVIDKVFF